MTTVTFDPVAFRAQFTRFDNTICFPDAALNSWFAIASLYASPEASSGCFGLSDTVLPTVLNLITAHVGFMMDAANNSKATGVVTDARIDKIQVTVKAPPIADNSMFQFWLAQSPYGIQVLAILGVATAGGIYLGGSGARGAFRDGNGNFGYPCPGRC